MFEDTIDKVEKKGKERIGFGPRLGASILDLIINLGAVIVLSSILLSYGFDFLLQKGLDALRSDEENLEMMQKAMGDNFDFLLIVIAISATFSIIYSLIEGFFGASPGKMILGMKVAHADASRGDINLYMKRWIVKNAGSVLATVNIIFASSIFEFIASTIALVMTFGCFAVLGNNKQALHDIIANTAVFKKSDLSD